LEGQKGLQADIRCGKDQRPLCGTKRTLVAISMMAASGPLRTFVDGAANGSKEPILDIFCVALNVRYTDLRLDRDI
jgi:hypothetical protein